MEIFTKHAAAELTLAVQYSVIHTVDSRAEVIGGRKRYHLLSLSFFFFFNELC